LPTPQQAVGNALAFSVQNMVIGVRAEK